MGEFKSESAISHLKEHWDDLASPIAFSGIGKLVDFYDGLLSTKQIKNELSKLESYSFMSEKHHHKKKKNVQISMHPCGAFQIKFFMFQN